MRHIEGAVREGTLYGNLYIKGQGDPKLVLERMELDETGFPQPTGELDELEADALVLALGQECDLSLVEDVPDIEVVDVVVTVGPNLMTGHAGVFAGGDMVPAERSVTVAIGHGKKAARNIDAWLHDTTYEAPPKHEVATFETLNTWYYADAPRTHRPRLDVVRRQDNFDEVSQGFDESNALFEARRCMSCGNCFSCDNCYGVCPDNAVLKLGEPGEDYIFGFGRDFKPDKVVHRVQSYRPACASSNLSA